MALVYKIGSKGEGVKALQSALADAGYYVKVDGDYGPKTEAAIKAFQKASGVRDDGIAGPVTMSLLAAAKDSAPEITKAHINTHITRCTDRQVKYIAIHYTAGSTSRKGTALSTRNVFLSRSASADFVVDDGLIVQINPDIRNYYCWAVGDKKNAYSGGGRLYGVARNRNTVSIEICSCLRPGTTASVPNHSGWYFTDSALENARRLVRYLMRVYGINKENVIRHYDVSGKPCPGIVGWNNAIVYTTDGKPTSAKSDSGKWDEFLASI